VPRIWRASCGGSVSGAVQAAPTAAVYAKWGNASHDRRRVASIGCLSAMLVMHDAPCFAWSADPFLDRVAGGRDAGARRRARQDLPCRPHSRFLGFVGRRQRLVLGETLGFARRSAACGNRGRGASVLVARRSLSRVLRERQTFEGLGGGRRARGDLSSRRSRRDVGSGGEIVRPQDAGRCSACAKAGARRCL
jgi:hypothetical protein